MSKIDQATDDFWAAALNKAVPAQWAGRLSAEEGMRVQLGIADRWVEHGIQRVGWKVGATNKAVRAQLGVDSPAFGSLLENAVLWSGRALEVGGAAGAHVECELCFRVKDSLADAKTIEDVAKHVSYVFPAFEVIEKRVSLKDVGVALADNAETWRIVLGDPIVPEPGLDFSKITCTLSVDGSEVETGTGDLVMDNPLNSLLWLATSLHALGRELRPGELVMTGSFVRQRPLTPGERARAEFSGIGSVDLPVIK